MATPPKPKAYSTRPIEPLNRRLERYQFQDAIFAAKAGKTSALCALIEFGQPDTDENRELLVKLIKYRLERKGRGRKTPWRHPADEMEREIASAVIRVLRARRKRYGRKRALNGEAETIANDIINERGHQGDFQGLNVSLQNILRHVARGLTKTRKS